MTFDKSIVRFDLTSFLASLRRRLDLRNEIDKAVNAIADGFSRRCSSTHIKPDPYQQAWLYLSSNLMAGKNQNKSLKF